MKNKEQRAEIFSSVLFLQMCHKVIANPGGLEESPSYKETKTFSYEQQENNKQLFHPRSSAELSNYIPFKTCSEFSISYCTDEQGKGSPDGSGYSENATKRGSQKNNLSHN